MLSVNTNFYTSYTNKTGFGQNSKNCQTEHSSRSNVNFKSILVPNENLDKGFDAAITNGFDGHKFLNAVKRILNDGRNDKIEISQSDSGFTVCGVVGQDIFVNGKRVVKNDFQTGTSTQGEQCMKAFIDYADNYAGTDKETPYEVLDEMQSIIGLANGKGELKNLTYTKLMDKINFLKKNQAGNVAKELVDIKNEVFAEFFF